MLALAVGPLSQALASVIVFLVGTILLVTGLVKMCPLNRLLGLHTYRQRATGEADEQPAIDQK